MSARLPGFAAAMLMLFAQIAAAAPGLQQGGKLVGFGATGAASQGYAVSVSADGNTAIVGGYVDNSSAGAAWVYARNGGAWSQQGPKLVGTGATTSAYQGFSVAISGDGNTAIVGGYVDNSSTGAAWVYTRSSGAWSQQGAKLVGTGAVGAARQGYSLAISGDGNTIIVGGYLDSSGLGAAWVYTRTAGVWSQQGTKLVGSGGVGASVGQGYSVALSSDGNTAVVGGYADNANTGAAWVYTRTAGVWSQQGAKLVGTGAVGAARQGYSVAVSADGNTALVGGYADNSTYGAVWAYTRSGGVWSQQGAKLLGTGEAGAAFLGTSVSLSADGNTALVGGYGDNSFIGAAWAFARSAGVWNQQGTKLVGTGAVGTSTGEGFSVSLSADGRTGIVGGYGDNATAGAAWIYVDPTPAFAAISDVPNDQGGKVSLRWSASLADNEPSNPIDTYWIWRQVPNAMAVQALSNGANLVRDGAAIAPTGRAFRTTIFGAQVNYWEYVGSQAADGYPGYSYTGSTTSDSLPDSNPYTVFMVEAKQLSTGARWPADPDSGYSVDNLAPAAPTPFTATYAAGTTSLHWGASPEADFAMYRLYRGNSAGFTPGVGNLVAARPDTGYADPGPAGSYYKLSAVDIHGNESGYSLVTPTATLGVAGGPLAFALERPRNPVSGRRLSLAFTLPSDARATLEAEDVSGRQVLRQEVGTLGTGRHSITLASDGPLSPGVYFIRLTQGSQSATARVTVLE